MDLHALLQMPELGLTLLSGQGHLDRKIRWVVPTDLPDPRRYLSGGELVLTGMLWRHDETDADKFVGCIAAAGVSALGAGDPERSDIPAELVDACRRHDLPLFHVSPEVSFSTITERVVQRLSAHRSADVAAVLGRHRQLIASGGGLGEVLALVHDELGMDCQILSATGRVIRSSTPEATPSASARRTIAAKVLGGGPLPRRIRVNKRSEYSVFGVGGPSPHCGWMLVVDDDHTQWPPQRRDVTEELVALISLELRRTVERDQSEHDLVLALDTGADHLASHLAHAGLSGPGGYVVAVCTATGPASLSLGPSVLTEAIAPASAAFTLARRHGEVIAVARVESGHAEIVAHAREVAATLSKGLRDDRVAIGISDAVDSAEALTGALSEARHAVHLATAREAAVEVAGPDDLTSHVLLMATVPDGVRRAYRSKVLGPVLEYDKEHKSELVSTLEEFLECEGSWSRCAAKLHLHVNTLRYRIERVERLTGRDLRRLTDRVDLFLALRVP
ncbi:PucR family transcriptional regulator [Stackebrandtia nassauensis]|uniref:Transcriptional regulator, PucR family n=1 Tax=Stackebrandtia nassauensis (strain DSM 44728 / CIP 108903 / NRRL B-16338 / NBRC 102104 / LLR-40K-21) TaxID=446470 RepID=D3Q641_STANL|nr:PucR family transcriptional regulator [Stackebrandtia nassauensis]ADD42216.1 transcriptional regulator, PucR family [Stackebrandtia nassauensis DSM 44728]